MKKALKGASVCLTLLGLSCCGQGLLDEMDRVLADPTITAPKAVSFAIENQIGVSWDRDRAADLYVLERAKDAASPAYTEVYRGTATSFADTGVAEQIRYLYRLSKIRGEKVFGPSGAVMGIGSLVCGDDYEPNDTEEQAIPLEHQEANLFYYRAYSGIEVQDADWYSVTVPPTKRMNIVLTQIDPGIAAAATTYMFFYQKGLTPQRIVNNNAFWIDNTSHQSRTFVFKIYPKPEDFITDPTLAGGTIIKYEIRMLSITDII